MRRFFAVFVLAFALATATTAAAGPLMPSFDGAPTGWITDRYDPAGFGDIGLYMGRDNVLRIGISTADGATLRPGAYSSQFYNTQGKQYAIGGGAGDWIAADLFVDGSWADGANGNVRTDMWGVLDDPSLPAHEYPIVGFTNFDGVARFRAFDEDAAGGWVNLASPVMFNAWNSFKILFTGTAYEYYVNGVLAYTDNTTRGTGFLASIMQAYNFNDPTLLNAVGGNYEVNWSDDQAVPEPASLTLLGLGLVAGVRRFRRKA